VALFTK